MLFAVKPGLTAKLWVPDWMSLEEPGYDESTSIKLEGLDDERRPFHVVLGRQEFLAILDWWDKQIENKRVDFD